MEIAQVANYKGNDPTSLIGQARVTASQDPINAAMLLNYTIEVLNGAVDSLYRCEEQNLSEQLYRNPDNPMLLLRLAAVKEHSGKLPEAIEVYDKIIRMYDSGHEAGSDLSMIEGSDDLDSMINRLSGKEAQLICFARGQKELLQRKSFVIDGFGPQ